MTPYGNVKDDRNQIIGFIETQNTEGGYYLRVVIGNATALLFIPETLVAGRSFTPIGGLGQDLLLEMATTSGRIGLIVSANHQVSASYFKTADAGAADLALAQHKLYIGQSSGAAAETAMSGDAGIIDTGVLRLVQGQPFMATGVLTSALADTPVILLADAVVGAGRKVLITDILAIVNGAVAWTVLASVSIEDTAGLDFFNIAVAALLANAVIRPGSANTTIADAFKLGTGGGEGKGIQVAGNAAAATGDDLLLIVSGFIKSV